MSTLSNSTYTPPSSRTINIFNTSNTCMQKCNFFRALLFKCWTVSTRESRREVLEGRSIGCFGAHVLLFFFSTFVENYRANEQIPRHNLWPYPATICRIIPRAGRLSTLSLVFHSPTLHSSGCKIRDRIRRTYPGRNSIEFEYSR